MVRLWKVSVSVDNTETCLNRIRRSHHGLFILPFLGPAPSQFARETSKALSLALLMMDEETRKLLSDLVTALEHFWLESQAAMSLLEQYRIPNWFDLVYEYCERLESKALSQKRFASARALIQLAQKDSEALEALLSALQSRGKPN